MREFIDHILQRLALLVREGCYEALETETVEIKPAPSTAGDWKELHKSANAFLNSRGGILVLGIREAGQGVTRRYELASYREELEPRLKEFPRLFTDRQGNKLDLSEAFPPMQIRDFLDGRVVLVYVDELPADRKFVFYQNQAYRRMPTGDHKISAADIEAQGAYREEAEHAREMQPWQDTGVDDLSLDASTTSNI